MTAPNELGRAAYEAFIAGTDDRLPWKMLSSWVQSHWARVELACRKAENQSSERIRALAEEGRTSPTQLWGKR